MVNSERQLQRLLSELDRDKPKIVGLDTEFVKESMRGSVIIDADLFCTTLSWATSESRMVANYGVRVPVGNLWLIPSEWHTEALVRVLETTPVTGHNIMGADRHVLRECVGLHLHNIKFDTMHASRIYHHSYRYEHGLKAWAKRMDVDQIEYKALGKAEFRRQVEANPKFWHKKASAIVDASKPKAPKRKAACPNTLGLFGGAVELKELISLVAEVSIQEALDRALANMFKTWQKSQTLTTMAYNDNILKQLIDYAAIDARLHLQLYYLLVQLMAERAL